MSEPKGASIMNRLANWMGAACRAYFRSCLALLIVSIFTLPALAKDVSVKRWEVVDLSFQHENGDGLAPFEKDFAAVFASPSGQSLTVPGFYNGGGEYIIRFSGDEAGRWTYETTSSDAVLNGHEGVVTVTNTDAGLGPVVIDPDNSKRFRHAGGEPHMMLAFELDWLFALDYDNDQGIPKTERLIADVRKSGFNTIVMNVYAHDVKWEKDPALLPEHEHGGREDIYPFGGSNSDPDFSTLNVEFFRKLDRVIAHLNDAGITAHLMIYVWNKDVAWPDMNTDADNRYFDYVIKRYQAFPNIHWDISKEAFAYGRADTEYILERIDRARRLDVFDRLLTVHAGSFAVAHPEVVDFASVQNWANDITPVLRKTVDGIDKPVLMVETGCYEHTNYTVFSGTYDDAETCLDRAYRSIFAGAYASYYWQSAAWNVIVADLQSLPAVERPKLEYYAHMAKVFDGSRFADLVPPDRNPCNSAYALTDGDQYFRMYVPAENHSLYCARFGTYPNGFIIRWFNTLTGETTTERFADKQNSISFQAKPWKRAPAVMSIEPITSD